MMINIKHVGVCAGIVAGAIVGDVLVEKVVKPIGRKLKESRNGVKVTIDGEPVKATIVGA